ncbi:MAG: hypothetical protein E6R03_10580 [Hyphomicrobiaceae bacterium]|nr:MAG: hypothetical protein E6R03_10580 [Hyphomicrobiaceae bacterium]
MSTSEAIRIANASLTRTGNEPITSLDDGSAEAVVIANNYDLIIEEELCAYPYSWAKAERQLSRLDEESIEGWAYIFQLPSDCIRVVKCHVGGKAVPFKRKEDKIYSNEESLSLEYIFRPEEEDWGADFKGKIIGRLEALCLRALSEDYDKAEAIESRADEKGRLVKSQDSQNQSPQDRRPTSRLVSCRRA